MHDACDNESRNVGVLPRFFGVTLGACRAAQVATDLLSRKKDRGTVQASSAAPECTAIASSPAVT
jgi:hypothetical protein